MMFPSRRFVAGLAFCTIPFALDLGIPGLWRLGWLAVAVLFAVTLLDALFTPRRGAFEVSLRLTPVLTLASEEPIGVEIRNRAGSEWKSKRTSATRRRFRTRTLRELSGRFASSVP